MIKQKQTGISVGQAEDWIVEPLPTLDKAAGARARSPVRPTPPRLRGRRGGEVGTDGTEMLHAAT